MKNRWPIVICASWICLGAVLSYAATPAGSSADPPYPRIMSTGTVLPGCDVVSDTGFDVLDWNGDGKMDFMLEAPSMTSFYGWINEGTPTEPRFGHSSWYPLNLTESEPYGMYFTQTSAACDLNHDGLFDLLVFDGQLRMLFNTGSAHGPNHWNLAMPDPYFPGSPAMIKENARLTLTPETMYWGKGVFPRQVLTMTVADWDGDGFEDLIVCRFKEEAPGVKVGRGPAASPAQLGESTWNEKLTKAPERGVYFYKNVGTRELPWFDKGVEITTSSGQSIAAPNPVVADIDGDGVLDIVSSETAYACNAYRVDWPTSPSVMWFRRPTKADVAHVEEGKPVMDADKQPIAAGVQVRVADFRGAGMKDLFVLDPGKGIRWYQNTAKKAAGKPVYAAPTVLRGKDFARFYFMVQPLVANWYWSGSRDLILHGLFDAHCRWGYRRTAVYRNVAKQPEEIKYEFGGFLNYRGDPAMVPQKFPFEERPDDVYGSAVALMPDDGSGKKRLVMSVAGQLYFFSNLAKDGLTFQERKPLNLPCTNHNRMSGWQELPVQAPSKVQYIRLTAAGESSLFIVNFEALAGGKNYATTEAGAQFKPGVGSVQNPQAMLTPGNQPSETRVNFTTIRGNQTLLVLKEAVALEKIRFLLSDRDAGWYSSFWPFEWQGKSVRQDSYEAGEILYNYKVEVSVDQANWTVVSDRLMTGVRRSHPVFVDWDHDGKFDLLLGVLNAAGLAPHDKEYRLYMNKGSNDNPIYTDYLEVCDEKGRPLNLSADPAKAVAPQCGVGVVDRYGDGIKYDLVTEDEGGGNGLRYYQNVSMDPRKLRFKYAGKVGDPVTIDYPLAYRAFYVGLVDDDLLVDYISSNNGELTYFKGIEPTAPSEVTNLTVISNDADGFEVRWTKPAGASRFELRIGLPNQVTEAVWRGLQSQSGEYDVADGAMQTRRFVWFKEPWPPADEASKVPLWPKGNTLVAMAIKSTSPQGKTSGISNLAQAVTPKHQSIILRNGPADQADTPAYKGTQACCVDAARPTQAQPGKLEARTLLPFSSLKQRMTLLRFTDLPKLDDVKLATLELTTESQKQLQGMAAAVETSCNGIRGDWDVAKATFTEAAPGKPWAPGELDAGGTFLSLAPAILQVQPRHTLQWDVTQAIREALKAGKSEISLLIRCEYTGKYVGGVGYNFCGPENSQVEYRPRLRLITGN